MDTGLIAPTIRLSQIDNIAASTLATSTQTTAMGDTNLIQGANYAVCYDPGSDQFTVMPSSSLLSLDFSRQIVNNKAQSLNVNGTYYIYVNPDPAIPVQSEYMVVGSTPSQMGSSAYRCVGKLPPALHYSGSGGTTYTYIDGRYVKTQYTYNPSGGPMSYWHISISSTP